MAKNRTLKKAKKDNKYTEEYWSGYNDGFDMGHDVALAKERLHQHELEAKLATQLDEELAKDPPEKHSVWTAILFALAYICAVVGVVFIINAMAAHWPLWGG